MIVDIVDDYLMVANTILIIEVSCYVVDGHRMTLSLPA